jgi:hypothetical protein
MENKKYPQTFKSMEDVNYVIENFPEEVWHDDLQDLLSRTQGYVLLGKNPKFKSDNRVVVDALSLEEISEIQENTLDWGDIQMVPSYTNSKEFYTFEYHDDTILCNFGELPYASLPWVDKDRIVNVLYGFDKIQDLQNKAKELKDSIDELPWRPDEAQKENADEVERKLMDKLDGLSFGEIERLDKLIHTVCGIPIPEHVEEECTDEQDS